MQEVNVVPREAGHVLQQISVRAHLLVPELTSESAVSTHLRELHADGVARFVTDMHPVAIGLLHVQIDSAIVMVKEPGAFAVGAGPLQPLIRWTDALVTVVATLFIENIFQHGWLFRCWVPVGGFTKPGGHVPDECSGGDCSGNPVD